MNVLSLKHTQRLNFCAKNQAVKLKMCVTSDDETLAC